MKYMLLIYHDELALSEVDREECYKESTELAHQLKVNGQFYPPILCSQHRWRPASVYAMASN